PCGPAPPPSQPRNKRRHATRVERYREDAGQGFAHAQHGLGYMYENGRGVAQDYAQAVHWYRKAAAQGLAEAQHGLGYMYQNSRGVAQDYAQAVRWYRKAAAQGLAKAQTGLGVMYENGRGVAQDYAKAVRWYRKAAAQGGEGGKLARRRLAMLGVSIAEEAAATGQGAGRPTRPPPKPETAAFPSLGLVMAIQKRLADLGYGPGPADGIVGRETRAAIQAFQAVAGLAETGEASRDLLNRLIEEARAVKTAPDPPSAPAAIPAGLDFGRYFALVIGNDDYRSLPRLKTAVADAKAVAGVLERGYGFETSVLIDATRAGILDALDGLRRRLREDDNLLIYYAGHGWLDRDANRGYWQPVDADEDRRANWLSNADITDTLKAVQARHVMVVADSCYSGTLTRSGKRGVSVTARAPGYAARLARLRSRTVLSSGGLEPVADSGGGGHSVFAKALLDVLRGNTVLIDGTDLFAKVRQQVRLNAEQTPQYQNIRMAGHEVGGDFLFVRHR
ncbi:MAG: caspase family protein, partial [Rhodospirillales bacterium]|nr:caspase family protein [Rhodospirillales bacterium]